MFTRKAVPKAEYCLLKKNMRVDQVRLDEPTLAMLSGISKKGGQETYMVFDFSVNIPKFKQYLDQLRADTGTDKICLFMDQLTVHTSNKAKEAMRAHGFKFIYNVTYII